MREGRNMGIMTTLKKPTAERRGPLPRASLWSSESEAAAYAHPSGLLSLLLDGVQHTDVPPGEHAMTLVVYAGSALLVAKGAFGVS
jgi:hypothetical protein